MYSFHTTLQDTIYTPDSQYFLLLLTPEGYAASQGPPEWESFPGREGLEDVRGCSLNAIYGGCCVHPSPTQKHGP